MFADPGAEFAQFSGDLGGQFGSGRGLGRGHGAILAGPVPPEVQGLRVDAQVTGYTLDGLAGQVLRGDSFMSD